MQIKQDTFEFTDTGNVGKIAIIIGAVGLGISLVGLGMNKTQFFHSYLTAFVFWVTIGLGGLFFTLVHHLVDATWSVVVRRLAESIMATLPKMIIFFLPIAFIGLHDLYHWTHTEDVAKDVLLAGKTPFLNEPFFIARGIAYFVIWFVLAHLLYSASLKQDREPSEKLSGRMRTISGPGMVLFALSITFAAFDWLMSLDPHWYSTIFGVCFFAGSFVSFLCFMTIVLLVLRKHGILEKEVTIEHYHDLGKLIFAFTIFWTYVSFSQYFLIWYGNIPEETLWYHHRWDGGWKYVSLALVFGHFVLPFLFLISREPKRCVKCMMGVSIWMLVMHFIEMFWQVMPYKYHHLHVSWMDITTFVGVGGIFVFLFWRKFTSQVILPVKDPNLQASLKFTNM